MTGVTVRGFKATSSACQFDVSYSSFKHQSHNSNDFHPNICFHVIPSSISHDNV